jgi:low temperature requirement protein LtrA
MRARVRREAHRPATPLELFFDLVFVVAVAQASAALHHGLAEGRIEDSVVSYAMVFFAIWWAWMNVTWFASAYDNDDLAYRLAMFVQMTGALILAAGVPRAFEERDFGLATLGYAVMRVALVAQWLRASIQDPPHRVSARRFAIGVTACQVGWIVLLLFVPPAFYLAGFALMALAELSVPAYAERAAPTTWHPGHIVERYGLFTIIVLGESILAGSLALQSATDGSGLSLELGGIVAGGLLIVFSLWWLYFDYPTDGLLRSLRTAFAWGYGHFAIFASAAAVGAGLAVVVDEATDHGTLGAVGAGAAVAVPVAIYLFAIWALHGGWAGSGLFHRLLVPSAAVLVLLTPLTGQAVLLTGLVVALLVTIKVAQQARPVADREPAEAPGVEVA